VKKQTISVGIQQIMNGRVVAESKRSGEVTRLGEGRGWSYSKRKRSSARIKESSPMPKTSNLGVTPKERGLNHEVKETSA